MFAQVLMLVGFIAAVARADVEFHEPPPTNMPEAGFVPTADVAIAIAVAIWKPIYGKDRVAREKPYHAFLMGRIWVVSGSLPHGMSGDVLEVRILQSDGRIMGVN
jgi:hypothetical protein